MEEYEYLESKMLCEKCKSSMVPIRRNSVQGVSCPSCGWEVVTTYIEPIYLDIIEYSIYINDVMNIQRDQIRAVSRIADVNYLTARHMLEKGNMCILKAKAIDIKTAINELKNAGIPFEVTPEFFY